MGKYMSWSLFLIKLQGFNLQSVTLFKKSFQQRCFPENFANFSEHFFIEYLRVTASENHVYLVLLEKESKTCRSDFNNFLRQSIKGIVMQIRKSVSIFIFM